MDKKIGGALVVLALFILAVSTLAPIAQPSPDVASPTDDVKSAIWEYRTMDVIVQACIVLAGVLGVLALLREEEETN